MTTNEGDHRRASSQPLVADLLDTTDWSTSPLGDRSTWPLSLRTLIDTMLASRHGMMLAWGPELTLFYNDAYAPFLGLRHPWAFGRPFQTVWSDVWANVSPLVDQALAGKPVWFTEYHLVMERNGYPEDTWWQFSYSAVRDDDGAVAGLLNVTSEMTAKVQVERQLRALNADLEQRVIERALQRGTLWQVSSDLLSVIDIDSATIDAVNPAWTVSLGWEPAEIEGKPFVDFIHPDDRAASAEAYERIRAGDPVLRFENRYRTKRGEWRWLSWVALPERGKLYSTVRDITEDKTRQAELEATQEALRQSQKMESMGQLTGGVAHDFNNLLTPIIGSLDMLMRRGLGSDRERRLIDGALEAAERAKTLVQRLLAFARRQPLQATAIDVVGVVEGMVELIGSTLGPQYDVRLEIAPDLPPATADANQLEMALLNLAVNARDAMPGGGTLTIGAVRDSVTTPHPAGLARGHYVQLYVGDTGMGMDSATRMRAVEPFFSTKGIGKGTGLGLSMVHGLAAQLGGGLAIDSAPGSGTTVRIWFPVSTIPVARGADGGAQMPTLHRRGTALLVDDEELVRASTAHMLSDIGFDVIEATSAEGALRLLETDIAPDILVTDHLMPGMTGADLVRRLAEIRPALPALIVSGYAEAEGVSPTTPRLTKPFRVADLAEKVEALLARTPVA